MQRILLTLLILTACNVSEATRVSVSPLLDLAAVNPAAIIDNRDLTGLDDRALDGSILVTTDLGRLALTQLVTCALRPDQTFTVGGVDFFGDVGLAPEWTRHKLSERERQLVTGCTLAHLSASDLPTVISITGPDSALTQSIDEETSFTVEDGRFFGDTFSNPQIVAACTGTGRVANPDDANLQRRICAVQNSADPTKTQCGLLYAGTCGDVCNENHCEIADSRFRAVTVFVQ